jgi:hypothetical protein
MRDGSKGAYVLAVGRFDRLDVRMERSDTHTALSSLDGETGGTAVWRFSTMVSSSLSPH